MLFHGPQLLHSLKNRSGVLRNSQQGRSPKLEHLEPRIVLSTCLAGELDSTFAGDGTLTTQFPDPPGLEVVSGGVSSRAKAVAIAPDGKIVAAGWAEFIGGYTWNSAKKSKYVNTHADFAVVRYNTDGTLDASFDDDGIALTDFQTEDDRIQEHGLVIQPDGQIVVAGSTSVWVDDHWEADLALVRYLDDGSLDPSFGNDGKVTLDLDGDSADIARGTTIQPDGKIIVVGRADDQWMVTRFNTDGSIDSSFDGDGKIISSVGTPSNADFAREVAVQPDGKLVVTGEDGLDIITVRYNADGSVDSTFGTDGSVTATFSAGQDSAREILIQPDGKLLVSGRASGQGGHLTRYLTDGSLDQSFGTNGIVINTVGGEFRSIALRQDGKIVAGGFVSVNDDKDYRTVRYNSDGTLDTAYGDNGSAVADVSGVWEEPFEIAMQPSDGNIVMAGFSEGNFGLARFCSGDPAAPGITVTPTTGLETTEGGQSDTFSIVLDAAPTNDVTISLSSSDTSEGTVSPTSVTFTTTDWDSPQVATVTGVDDTETDGDVAYSIVTGPATSVDVNYEGLDADDVSVVNQDDESVGPVDVTNISPAVMDAGTSIAVTISGASFAAGANVTFENGSGPGPSASGITVVNSTTITATISVSGGGPKSCRVWDVRVTNSDSSTGVLSDGFSVDKGNKCGSALLAGSHSSEQIEADDHHESDIVSGVLLVSIDNASSLEHEQLARITDSIDHLNAVLAPFGSGIQQTDDDNIADVRIRHSQSSACGEASDGVLGCESNGIVTLISGWSWYTGSDPTLITHGQYDYQTAVTHELAHALGLGHSDNVDSVLSGLLESGATQRTISDYDQDELLGAKDQSHPRPSVMDVSDEILSSSMNLLWDRTVIFQEVEEEDRDSELDFILEEQSIL